MILYSLKCSNDHVFESWFRSAEAFEGLRKAGHLSCPECGTSTIEKALMAPSLRAAGSMAEANGETPPEAAPGAAGATAPGESGTAVARNDSERAEAVARLRRAIEARSEYVGLSFAAEARSIQAGEARDRMIHGEAKPDEARALIDEGIVVTPLPFIPTRRTS